ncbi:MAG: hypothetical protein AAF149_07100 [Bacteroidota bacterium]
METWLEILSLMKGISDALLLGVNLDRAINKNREDPATRLEAERIVGLATFSEEEVAAILKRLQGCRDRFIEQGGGQERAFCLCSGSVPDSVS